MEPTPRIELGPRPYHGRVLPLNYEGMEPTPGIEPGPPAYEAGALPVGPREQKWSG